MNEWLHANRALLGTSGAIFGIVLAATLLLRWVLARSIRDVDLRQRLRNGLTFLAAALVLALNLVLWFEQVAQTVLALAALAAATVIAAKELILCVTGGAYRAIVSPYKIGDRIEVGGVQGDVVDAGLLATTLFEVKPTIGQGYRSTGRFVVVPHSVLFSGPALNTTRSPFNWHEFTIAVAPGAPWRELEAALLELARAEYEPIRAEMDAAVEELCRELAWRPPPSTPAVFVCLDDRGLIALTVRYPVRVRHGRMSEDRIVRGLLGRFGPEAFRRANGPS